MTLLFWQELNQYSIQYYFSGSLNEKEKQRDNRTIVANALITKEFNYNNLKIKLSEYHKHLTASITNC